MSNVNVQILKCDLFHQFLTVFNGMRDKSLGPNFFWSPCTYKTDTDAVAEILRSCGGGQGGAETEAEWLSMRNIGVQIQMQKQRQM